MTLAERLALRHLIKRNEIKVPLEAYSQADYIQALGDPNSTKKALATRFAIAELKLNRWEPTNTGYRELYKWIWLEKYFFVQNTFDLKTIKEQGEILLNGQTKLLTEIGLIVQNTGEILEGQTVLVDNTGTIISVVLDTQTGVNTLQGTTTQILNQTSQILAVIYTIQTSIGAIEQNLIVIQNGIKYLKTEIGLIADDLTLIKTELGFIKNGIEFIKTDIGFIKNDINIIKNDIGFIKDDIQYIKTDIGFIKDDISIIKNDLGFIKDGIQYIKTELGYIRQTVDEIKLTTNEILGTVKDNNDILTNMQENGVTVIKTPKSSGGGSGFNFTTVIFAVVGITVLALIFKFLKGK